LPSLNSNRGTFEVRTQPDARYPPPGARTAKDWVDVMGGL
jgi:hypothetical protein